jgi:spermidine synthase
MGDRKLKILSFALSFCGFAYQSLMAKTFAVTLGEEIIGFCLSSALFILGIGLGSKKSALATDPLRWLFFIELRLMVLGATAPLIVTYLSFVPGLRHIQIGEIVLQPALLVMIFALGSGLTSLFLGFLTGYETPLLFRLRADQTDQRGINQILAFSYFGALMASLLIPVFVIPRLEIYGTALIVAFFSGCLCLTIYSHFPKKEVRARSLLIAAFGLVILLAAVQNSLQQVALRITYYDGYPSKVTSLAEISDYVSDLSKKISVQRTLSSYQAIDLVDGLDDDGPFFQLYLNRQFQFDSRFEKEYHYAFLQGALRLAPFTPKKVLILGAGDGLLLRDVLATLPETTEITMVELDPVILSMAKGDPRWTNLNKNSLLNPKVHLVTDDAFHFLRETKDTWDAVFLDFPYPFSYEVSKLFSLEFYRMLHHRLAPESFIVFDFPVRASSQVVHSTLRKVPFKSIVAYEKGETFVFATDLQESALHLETFRKEFTQTDLPPAQDQFVHSLFKPTLPTLEE